LRALLNEGLENQQGKSKATIKAEASALGVDKKITSSDSDSDSDSDDEYAYSNQQSRTVVHIDDSQQEATGIEVFHELTLEDIIEAQRAKLAAEGKQGKHCLCSFLKQCRNRYDCYSGTRYSRKCRNFQGMASCQSSQEAGGCCGENEGRREKEGQGNQRM
jgi:hypothetical protein